MKRVSTHTLLLWSLILLVFPVPSNSVAQTGWEYYTAGKRIHDIVETGGIIWAATESGLVSLNPATSETNVYLTTNSQIPTERIVSLAAASGGTFWIGSYKAGLVSFDGTNWQIYNTGNSDLSHNTVNDIHIAANGTVWAATDSGLCSFDGSSWQVYTTGNSPLPNNKVNAVIEEGTILWVGTEGGLARKNGVLWDTFGTSNGLPGIEITAVIYDSNFDDIWIGTRYNGVAVYDRQTWQVYDDQMGLPSNFITSLSFREGAEIGELWAGTYGGAAWFSGTAWVEYTETNSDLPGNEVLSVLAMENGAVWTGTDYNGLGYYNGNVWSTYVTGNSDLAADAILDIDSAPDGNVWIATDGGGAAAFDGTDWQTYSTANSTLPDNILTGVAVANDGTVFFATLENGIASFDGTDWQLFNTSNSDIPDNFIADIAIDSSGNIWVATFYFGAGRFDGTNWRSYNTGNSGIPTDQLGRVAVAPNGDIWFGSYEGGAMKYDGVQWTSYTVDNSDIPSNMATSIGFAPNGNVWIGTNDNGIGVFNGTNWQLYNTANSNLADNIILSIATDQFGRNWVCTESGIASFYAGSWNSFTVGNNTTGNPIPLCIDFDANGKAWVGTDILLAAFNPSPINLDITITSPNGGESWFVNSSHNITWTSSNVTNINIEYSFDNGVSWVSIADSVTASIGSYSWTIPSTPSNTCLVRISNTDDAAVNDISDNTFEIVENTQQTIELTSPGSGETLTGGSQYEIFWNTSLITTFTIELNTSNGTSLGDGTEWITINNNVNAVNGSYMWTVPDRPTAEGRIRIIDNNDSTNTILSDGFFTIISSTPMVNQNFPNPFNPATEISFSLPKEQHISVVIYNALGEQIAVLADNVFFKKGLHSLTFNAQDIPSGVYFYRVSGDNFTAAKKMLLLR